MRKTNINKNQNQFILDFEQNGINEESLEKIKRSSSILNHSSTIAKVVSMQNIFDKQWQIVENDLRNFILTNTKSF